MRVYEIAKEVGIPNKDLIAKIRALGLEVNNHMSSLDADDVARIKRSLEKEKAGGDKPAQTQRLTTGATVLRRRSAADKADGEAPKAEETRAAAPAAAAPATPSTTPPAPSTSTPSAPASNPSSSAPPTGRATLYRHCERVAKPARSNPGQVHLALDCFVATLLAMTPVAVTEEIPEPGSRAA